jgi:hypothetical protein
VDDEMLDGYIEHLRACLRGEPGDFELRAQLGDALDQRFMGVWAQPGVPGAAAVAAARADRDEAAELIGGLLENLSPDDELWPDVAVTVARLRYQRYADQWPDAARADPADLDAARDLLPAAVRGEPQPTEEEPGEPQPGEPQPGEPQPAGEEPGEPQPGEPQPGEPQPGEPQPGEPQPGEPQPGEPQPAGEEPGEPQPGEPQPGEPQPGEPQPGEEERDLCFLVACDLIDRAQSGGAADARADLDAAIGLLEMLHVSPPDEAEGTSVLLALVPACWLRIGGDASQYDLVDRLVRYARLAWQLPGLPDEERPLLGLMLAVGLHEQFIRAEAPYDPGGVDLGITALTEVEPRLAGDAELHLMAEVTLGNFLIARGQYAGNAADLVAAEPYLLHAATVIPPDDPGWSEVRQTLASAISILASSGLMTEHLDLAVDLERAAVAQPSADAERAAMHRAGLGTALIARAFGRREPEFREGIGHLVAAHEMAPPGSSVRALITWNLASALVTRYFTTGDRQALQAARFYLDLVHEGESAGRTAMGGLAPDRDALLAAVTGITAVARGMDGDVAALDEGVAGLRTALGLLPPGHPMAGRLRSDLGLALLTRASRGAGAATAAGFREAQRELDAAVAMIPPSHPMHGFARVRAGDALAAVGLAERDPRVIRQAIGYLARVHGELGPGFGELPRVTSQVGFLHAELYGLTGEPGDLHAAEEWLARAAAGFDLQPGHPQHANLLIRLARLRRGGRAGSAVETGLAALRVRVRDVLLQAGPAHGLAAARTASAEAAEVAGWCLEDGDPATAVAALELGRGLVLHAATSVADLPELLAAAGRHDLAGEWRAEAASGAGQPWEGGAGYLSSWLAGAALVAPSDLRERTLGALAGSAAGRLLAPPGHAEIADALARLEADWLVYLLPPAGDRAGRALLVPADGTAPRELPLPGLRPAASGPLGEYETAHARLLAGGEAPERDRWRDALGSLCEWAWPAVVGPLLRQVAHGTPRLVLVPAGRLSLVPWHAARFRSGSGSWRYACAEAVFSYAASGRQLVEASRRPALPLQAEPVIVAPPAGDLPFATAEAQALRDCFYPGARYLGDAGPGGRADGRGRPDEVLAALPSADRPGASVLHLACHGDVDGAAPEASHLLLAGRRGSRLLVKAILRQASGRPPGAPGGLVDLAACRTDLTAVDYDEALTLATAFLAAGAATVVGTRWEIPDGPSSVLMFMLHRFLVRDGCPPREALRRAQLWMLGPHPVPPEMPAVLAEQVSEGLADVAAWAGLAHQGR